MDPIKLKELLTYDPITGIFGEAKENDNRETYAKSVKITKYFITFA